MSFAFPPRRMRADAAAYYMDVSKTTFLARVEANFYPPGRREVGGRFWLRDDLDSFVDRQFDVSKTAELDVTDPFTAPAKHGKRRTLASF